MVANQLYLLLVIHYFCLRLVASAPSFYWGVASGDPDETSVVLWTKIYGPNATSNAKDETVIWEVAKSSDMTDTFSDVVKRGTFSTNGSVDWTIKLVVDGLEPGTTYYYRFQDKDDTIKSPIGRTRTLPEADDASFSKVQFAVASCILYQGGFFTPLDHMPNRSRDIFGVIFLGDFIYEYGPGGYGEGSAISRLPDPPTETVNITAYRTRYAQYRNTTSMVEAMRWFPWFMVWDDHEFANNAWENGAKNHEPSKEGPWPERKNDAIKAYLEYTPVRPKADASGNTIIYRSFRFGKLTELIMTDTRAYGRDEILMNPEEITQQNRTILGWNQEDWLFDTLKTAETDGVLWKVIGNQVIFSALKVETVAFIDETILKDSWNGYPSNRKRVKSHIAKNKIRNVLWATGDIHTSWAIQVKYSPDEDEWGYFDDDAKSIGWELVTPSITSPIPINSELLASTAETTITTLEPQVNWLDLRHHGYYVLTLTPDHFEAEWFFVESVKEANTNIFSAKTINQGVNDTGVADSNGAGMTISYYPLLYGCLSIVSWHLSRVL